MEDVGAASASRPDLYCDRRQVIVRAISLECPDPGQSVGLCFAGAAKHLTIDSRLKVKTWRDVIEQWLYGWNQSLRLGQ